MSTPKTGRPRSRRPGSGGAASGPPGRGATAGAARPLPPGGTIRTPEASGARRAVERSSARALIFLRQLPTWLPPVALTLLLVAGLASKGLLGASALALVAAFMGWLAYVSWPTLAPRGRLLRLAAVTGLLALVVVQATR